MVGKSLWIVGPSLSGKTSSLIQQFEQSVQPESNGAKVGKNIWRPSVLLFAPTRDRRGQLADQISLHNKHQYPVNATTPLGFFQNEVILFWPLLISRLKLKPQFPVRLRPETEQELATQLWRSQLDSGQLRWSGVNEYRLVRRMLDLMQLAAVSGTPTEEIPLMLEQGLMDQGSPEFWDLVGEQLLRWRQWCWERGFLTYGIVAELYWRYLLDDPVYQTHLLSRFDRLLADDVDEYPSIAGDLFEVLLDRGVSGVFTYNLDGQVRSGLGADPAYFARLGDRFASRPDMTLMILPEDRISEGSLPDSLRPSLREWVLAVTNPDTPVWLDGQKLENQVVLKQTVSRIELLQETAEAIAFLVKTEMVPPEDIAAIAPGLDEIARYTMIQTLNNLGVPVNSLNDQRRLVHSPMIRALLTLLALVYPGLGRLVDRDAIAELLTILSQQEIISRPPSPVGGFPEVGAFPETSLPDETFWEDTLTKSKNIWDISGGEFSQFNSQFNSPFNSAFNSQFEYRIDPVRAGLLTDYCYAPDPVNPQLLAVDSFPRWDRLGYRATMAYQEIVAWIEQKRDGIRNASRSQIQGTGGSRAIGERIALTPIHILNEAIQKFLSPVNHLSGDRISALRELMETASHYWEVNQRLSRLDIQEGGTANAPDHVIVGQFIQLLRQGTVTANPFPVSAISSPSRGVTLATIFQYRSAKLSHRYHFWLDAGSPLWLSGGAATLFSSPLFLRQWSGRPWTLADEEKAGEERLERILNDLLSRVRDRLYLCHSQLSTSGQEQTGPLLSWVNAAIEV